jgi:hypothetical protein
MSPCTFWSASILATSAIAVLHFGQLTAFSLAVSDTTNLNSTPQQQTRERPAREHQRKSTDPRCIDCYCDRAWDTLHFGKDFANS